MHALGLCGDMSRAMFQEGEGRASVEDGSEGGVGRGSDSSANQHNSGDYDVLRPFQVPNPLLITRTAPP